MNKAEKNESNSKVKLHILCVLLCVAVLFMMWFGHGLSIVMDSSYGKDSYDKIELIHDESMGGTYIFIDYYYYAQPYNYDGYDIKYDDNGNMYIIYRGGYPIIKSLLSSRNGLISTIGSPVFYPVFVPVEKMRDINKIYIASASLKGKRLIWTKQEGVILEYRPDA